MKPRVKRILFWVIWALFVAAVVGWLMYIPYRPAELYRLVPSNAAFLSHHQQVSERIDELLVNPLVQAILPMAELEADDVALWLDDPASRRWLDRLLARDLLLQYVPALGPTRDPAWAFVGWIGSESIRLRWWLTRGRPAGFEKVRRHAGGSYWMVDTGGADGDPVLSIGLVEGILVGAWSHDPHAVRHLLDVYDGIAPRAEQPAAPINRIGTAPDRGWWRGPDLWDGGLTHYSFALDAASGTGLAGTVRVERPAALPTLSPTSIETMGRFWGGVPFMLIGADPDSLFQAALPYWPPPVIRAFHGLRATHAEGPLLLAITGGEYAGTLLAISVPALNIAWRINDEAAFLEQLSALLDGLNRAYRWGLVLTQQRAHGQTVYTIEGTGIGLYATLRRDQQVAFTIVDNWVIGASHQRTLNRFLERYRDPLALVEADEGGWQDAVRAGGVAGVGRLDIRRGARTLRLALMTWSMALLGEDGPEARVTRQRIQTARNWLDMLETWGEIETRLQASDDYWAVTLRIGDPD